MSDSKSFSRKSVGQSRDTRPISVHKHPFALGSLNVRPAAKGMVCTGFVQGVGRARVPTIRIGRLTDQADKLPTVLYAPSKFSEDDHDSKQSMELTVGADVVESLKRLQEAACQLIADTPAITGGKETSVEHVREKFHPLLRDGDDGDKRLKLRVNGSGDGYGQIEVCYYIADTRTICSADGGICQIGRNDNVVVIIEPQHCWAKGIGAYGLALRLRRIYIWMQSADSADDPSLGDISDDEEDVLVETREPLTKRARDYDEDDTSAYSKHARVHGSPETTPTSMLSK
jgi:hypothetical protein